MGVETSKVKPMFEKSELWMSPLSPCARGEESPLLREAHR